MHGCAAVEAGIPAFPSGRRIDGSQGRSRHPALWMRDRPSPSSFARYLAQAPASPCVLDVQPSIDYQCGALDRAGLRRFRECAANATRFPPRLHRCADLRGRLTPHWRMQQRCSVCVDPTSSCKSAACRCVIAAPPAGTGWCERRCISSAVLRQRSSHRKHVRHLHSRSRRRVSHAIPRSTMGRFDTAPQPGLRCRRRAWMRDAPERRQLPGSEGVAVD